MKKYSRIFLALFFLCFSSSLIGITDSALASKDHSPYPQESSLKKVWLIKELVTIYGPLFKNFPRAFYPYSSSLKIDSKNSAELITSYLYNQKGYSFLAKVNKKKLLRHFKSYFKNEASLKGKPK